MSNQVDRPFWRPEEDKDALIMYMTNWNLPKQRKGINGQQSPEVPTT